MLTNRCIATNDCVAKLIYFPFRAGANLLIRKTNGAHIAIHTIAHNVAVAMFKMPSYFSQSITVPSNLFFLISGVQRYDL